MRQGVGFRPLGKRFTLLLHQLASQAQVNFGAHLNDALGLKPASYLNGLDTASAAIPFNGKVASSATDQEVPSTNGALKQRSQIGKRCAF